MGKPTTFLAGLALSVAGATSAFAFPITYTETVTAASPGGNPGGSLNGTSFGSSAIVTLKFVGDTANITSMSAVFINDIGTASVSVSSINGGAAVNFTDMVGIASAPNAGLGHGTVSFADFSSSHDILDDTSSAFATYALLPIAKVIGDTATVGTPGFAFPVVGGTFILNSSGVVSTSPTFSTIPAPAVPEPSSVALLGVALAGLGVIRRRKSS